MKISDVLDEAGETYATMSYDQKRNIRRAAGRFAQAVQAGRSSIEDLDGVMQSKGYAGDVADAFRAEVEKILGPSTGHDAQQEPEMHDDDFDQPYEHEPEEYEVHTNPNDVSDTPAGIVEPVITSRKTKISKALGDVINPANMIAAGWTKHMGDEVAGAPKSSERTALVQMSVADKKGFNWDGHTWTPVGIWSKQGNRNKVILKKSGDNDMLYLVGEALFSHAIRAKGEHSAKTSEYLRGMVPMSAEEIVAEKSTGESMAKQTSMLAHLDTIDKQIEQGGGAQDLSESMRNIMNILR
jgi:hypothetical protein